MFYTNPYSQSKWVSGMGTFIPFSGRVNSFHYTSGDINSVTLKPQCKMLMVIEATKNNDSMEQVNEKRSDF